MSENTMNDFWKTSYLSGANADYVEALYERYLADPTQVEPHWRDYFASLPAIDGRAAADVSHQAIQDRFKHNAKHTVAVTYSADASHALKQVKVQKLIQSFRANGHRRANLDPLQLWPRAGSPDLELAYHGLTSADLATEFETDAFGKATLETIYRALNETYCGSIGVEYMHIPEPAETEWIKQQLEAGHGRGRFTPEQKQALLKTLTSAEGLERYLANRYVGQKRFGLDGGESLIPMLQECVQRAGRQNVKEIVVGMPHRGRLNVLVNIFGKPPQDLFDEFEGKSHSEEFSGDVKYHKGFACDIPTEGGVLHMAMAFNPSHLEIVDPVVEGSARARQDRRHDAEGAHVLPLLMHGDAAFAGQGVVMETFNLSQVAGYKTGGTLHIVVDNQVGFTTSNMLEKCHDDRSTLYCTDVAKMVSVPVFHVNGDDPEACVFVMQLALDYRMRFKKDVVIDLVCYRRLGHNEADEPTGSQPYMYQKIKNHPSARQLYANQLVAQGLVPEADPAAWLEANRDALDAGKPMVNVLPKKIYSEAVNWKPFVGRPWNVPVKTGVPVEQLKQLGLKLDQLPEGFELQAQVGKALETRRKMFAGEMPLDWGSAEALAFASLLAAGTPVRLSGQDCGRGTFSHRHALLNDCSQQRSYIPLQHLSEKQGRFSIYNSVLSEEAVLGYEYGYATAEPNALILWEAQYGDFANGAQVLFDQFISSGEQKWRRLCGLVMLLPHGFEGQGPEHSSARLERYLQLCAQENMQVCSPTTPAQLFHVLRRQILRPYRKPLIMMTPKSLLRHKLVVSSLDELAEGQFQCVIPEVDAQKATKVKRVILCAGRVYYDLLEYRRAEKLEDTAIIRVEQLYPFPEAEVKAVLASYTSATDIVFCQEEPENQGAWHFMQRRLSSLVSAKQHVRYAGRPEAAAPAVGYPAVHAAQQKELIEKAFEVKGK